MKHGTLYLVRHGETQANLSGAIVGVHDVPLTRKGVQDAHLIGANIRKDIDIIITSPQTRAMQTAEIIRKYQNIPIVEHPLLHPQNFGIIEGLIGEEARKKGLGTHLHTQDTNKYLHKVPGGESAYDMQARVLPEIQNIPAYCHKKVQNILYVDHNSILRSMVGQSHNIPANTRTNFQIGCQNMFNFSERILSQISATHHSPSVQNILDDIWETRKIIFKNNIENK